LSIQNLFHSLISNYFCFLYYLFVFRAQDSGYLTLHFLAFKIFSSYYSNWRNHFLIFIKVGIQPLLFFSHCILFSCCSISQLSCCCWHLKFTFPFIHVAHFICFFSHYSLLLAECFHFYLSHFSVEMSFS